MYITDFICTYKRMDSDTDKEYLYKIQMLQAFGLEQWDDRIIEQTINDLQLQIKDEEQFNALTKKPNYTTAAITQTQIPGEDPVFDEPELNAAEKKMPGLKQFLGITE